MIRIIAVLTQNILPIFLVAASGFALQRWLHLDKKALSSVVMNIFSPCLVFTSLVNSQLPGAELLGLAGFTLLVMLTMGLLALGMA